MEHVELSWKSKDGLKLFAQEWRTDLEPKAVVCLVHGLGEHSGRYKHVAAAFNAAGYSLLTIDLRGHGKSEGPRGHSPSLDCIFDDIELLLQHARGSYPGLPCFLYGHSLGGSLVMNYALRRKPALAGVISTSPGLKTAENPPAWKTTIGKLMYKLQPTLTMGNGLDREGLSRDNSIIDAYVSDPLVHDRVTARLGLDILQSGVWALEHANEWQLPLLLIHGTADRITNWIATQEFSQKASGNVTFIAREGGYHELHNEPDQNEVIQIMVRWIGQHIREPEWKAAAS